ncbi:energy transducer TonB [Sulfuriferula nivalis]|uniref:Protein TonB n=1 Tax=Sulfuriferula nivalis TaxID=2675298 RepID=A0A809RHD5_9PROT|nr:energy transducer TonB [Sulfuriferula nivalis]BBP01299.1 hypothetical protein SFSGTM_20070 [Sulfuriferula nivalis]
MTLAASSSITSSIPSQYPAAGRLFIVIGLHVGVLYALLNLPATQNTITPPRTLEVSLITPQPEPLRPEPAVPQPAPPKPQPKTITTPPVLTAKPEANKPLPVQVAEAPKPIASTPTISAAPLAEATPTPSMPATAPLINADYLNNPKPPYPASSRRLGEEGKVLLRVHVNIDGSVDKIELHRSSGFARLDDSAMNTVPDWKFVPARQGNQAVAAWIIVPISFNLRSN